jgi:hypothetical protein
MKKKISILLILTLSLSTILLFSTVHPVTASSSQGLVRPTRTILIQGLETQMELAYQREINFQQRQGLHFTYAATAATDVQNIINTAKNKNMNVTDLETALTAFNSQVASARTYHDQAVSLLLTHNGFDVNGKVADTQAAHQTLDSARQDLQMAHLTLTSATLALRTSLQTWRQQNHL